MATEKWQTYTNTTNGITIDYPGNWDFEEDLSIGVVIFAERETIASRETNPFAPVVNIIMHKLPGITLDAYSEQQIMRLKSMSPQQDVKVDRSATLAGHPAHKAIIRLQVDTTRSIQFYAIWTVHADICYSFFFNCEIQDFSKYQRILTRMLTSLKTTTPKIKTVTLLSHVNNEFNFYFKYPMDWTLNTREGTKGPLITVSNKFKFDDKEYHRDVKVTTQKRAGSLDEHVEKVRAEFKRMLVEKMVVEKAKLGSVEARIISWESDALEKGSSYMQVLTYDPTVEDSPLIILTLSTNAPKEDDYTTSVFDIISHSLRFLTDPTVDKSKKNWATYEHLIYKFGLSYDQSTYIQRDEGIPLTEASFIHKDYQDITPDQSPINFSVIVRQIPPDQVVDLKDMGKEIVENLKHVCGDSLDVLESRDLKVNGRPSRLVISRGIPISPTGEAAPEMLFVHKSVIDQDRQVAILFAFASPPEKWKQEWANVESYINTTYWV